VVHSIDSFSSLTPAPELHRLYIDKKRGQSGTYLAFPVDVWAFGVMTYRVMSGDYPFPSGTDRRRLLKLMDKKRFRLKDRDWAPDLKDMFQKIFEPNIKVRATLDQLSTHPWISDEYNKVELKVSQEIAKPHSDT